MIIRIQWFRSFKVDGGNRDSDDDDGSRRRVHSCRDVERADSDAWMVSNSVIMSSLRLALNCCAKASDSLIKWTLSSGLLFGSMSCVDCSCIKSDLDIEDGMDSDDKRVFAIGKYEETTEGGVLLWAGRAEEEEEFLCSETTLSKPERASSRFVIEEEYGVCRDLLVED